MSNRDYFNDYVMRHQPSWSEPANYGRQLLDYLDSYSKDPSLPIPKLFQFPCVHELAFAGDSTGEAIWGASNDLLHPSAYLRVFIEGGIKRNPVQCVHFYACVKGTLMGFYREHRVIVLAVKPDDFVLGEAF